MSTASEKKTDRLSAVRGQPFAPDSLVGSFFHSDADRGWQGCVVAEVAPSVYLVEVLSWLHGQPECQLIIALNDMTGWRFYDDAEWMSNAYEHGVKQRWEREREERIEQY